MQRQPRRFFPDHLAYLRTLPCICCGDPTSTEAAHVRFADLRIAKRQTGMAEKPDDVFTLPLCGVHHRNQHTASERDFWKRADIDPMFYALALFAASGDYERGCAIVRAAQPANLMAAG